MQNLTDITVSIPMKLANHKLVKKLLLFLLVISVLLGCGHRTDPRPSQRGVSPIPAIGQSQFLYLDTAVLLQVSLSKEVLDHKPATLIWELNQLEEEGCILCGKTSRELRFDLSKQTMDYPEDLLGPETGTPKVQVVKKKEGLSISIYFIPKEIPAKMRAAFLSRQSRFVGAAYFETEAGDESPKTAEILLVPPKDMAPPEVKRQEIWKLTCKSKGKGKGKAKIALKKGVTLFDERKQKPCLTQITKEVLLTWKPRKLKKGKVLGEDGSLQDYYEVEPLVLTHAEVSAPDLAQLDFQPLLTSGFYRLPVQAGKWTIHRKDSYGNLSQGKVVYEDAP